MFYCPYCEAEIKPINQEEVDSGEHDGYVYVHKEVVHPDDFNQDDYEIKH